MTLHACLSGLKIQVLVSTMKNWLPGSYLKPWNKVKLIKQSGHCFLARGVWDFLYYITICKITKRNLKPPL